MGGDRKKIAIIGSGCSGLGTAWALKDSGFDVHIFEKSPKLGGHTNTQVWRHNGQETPVDTGFIVMNTATYPNFIRFLDHVGIDTVETEMTFGVSRDGGTFEWSGEAQGIFAQRRNFFRLRHWRMIFDIVRFNHFALDLLADDHTEDQINRLGSSPEHRQRSRELNIGEYLRREGYSDAFRDEYLIPMTAAVWSTSPDKASLEFPALTLIRFMWNHHLLSTIARRPAWLTIPGGSQRYIEAIVKGYDFDRLHLHLSSTVTNVTRPQYHSGKDVLVTWTRTGSFSTEIEEFDHVVFACHGDQILPLLSAQLTHQGGGLFRPKLDASDYFRRGASSGLADVEREVFSSFETTLNTCYLHSDLSLMPTRRKCWTSWNYLVDSKSSMKSQYPDVSLTYCMNILQHLPEEKYGPVLVTMNPVHRPDEASIQGVFVYEHPLYTKKSVDAQRKLRELQNQRGVSYCGAWTNYGFHEDGFSSGLQVAIEHLGAQLPFKFIDSTFSRGHRPVLGWKDYVVRSVLLLILVFVKLGDRLMRFPAIARFVDLVCAVLAIPVDIVDRVGLLDII